jgi:hypothetical protein
MPFGVEVEQRNAHAHRRCGEGRYAVLAARCKHHPAGLQRKEVDSVDVQIDSAQEAVDVLRSPAFAKQLDIGFGVDVKSHPRQHIDLGLTD